MSKEQIEEISCNRCVHYEVCMYVNAKAVEFARAENCKLFKDNAGYRKQSEGEWEKLYDKAPRYVCTARNHLFNNKSYKYCPNCGAKMKGGEQK